MQVSLQVHQALSFLQGLRRKGQNRVDADVLHRLLNVVVVQGVRRPAQEERARHAAHLRRKKKKKTENFNKISQKKDNISNKE